MRKALALLSGGLDSMLAAKLITEQGVYVEGINFFTGFTGIGGRGIAGENKTPHNAQWVADQVGIKLNVVNVFESFKDILLHPKHGYGANLNPCLDCKIFMVRQAKIWMQEHGFDFLITGEVIGQRPMSQRKDTLPLVEKDTDELLLRPLCAKHLAPTLPEREGWVNRELLCSFHGRNRKPQMALAARFGFKEYPQPAGGCVLTDVVYTNRLKDLWQKRENKDYTLDEITLLKVGRHLRPQANFKVIVGRKEMENNFLEQYKNQFTCLYSTSHVGSYVLFDGVVNAATMELAAKIAAYFGKGREAEEVEIKIEHPDHSSQLLKVQPIAKIEDSWYL
jgi:tRNA-uridine 2-sulfurtransferase